MRFASLLLLISAALVVSSPTPELDHLADRSSSSSSSAQPVNIPITKRRQRFHRVNSTRVDFEKFHGHLGYLSHKYDRNLQNFRTNTGTPHPWHSPKKNKSAPKHQSRATGRIGLNNVYDFLWTGTMAWGTPAQSVLVDFDTGSADTILNSGAYRPGASYTSQRTYRTFYTSYGDGTAASGNIWKDTVTIGGLKARNGAIGVASSIFVDPASEGGNQGISGMAFQSISAFPYPGFFDSLRYAGVLSAPMFAFRLGDSGSSSLTLGGYPAAEVSGNISWIPINPNNGFWAVAGKITGVGSITAILDTGTTAIVAPPSSAVALFRSLGMGVRVYDGVYYGAFSCNEPPKITLTFGGKAVTLAGVSQTLGTDDDGACLSSIVGQDTGTGNVWIAGDAYLRNIISIFDKGGYRVGLASIRR
ncbi:hypothetical protein OC835_000322 [Tilletia horrida]|nr:hypothetical protein OC835_000322 [Tilletia horrida]KAK0566180.1 hypothetical protein OC844_000849 [Tilletia horrida]